MESAVSDIEKLIAINEIRELMARYVRFADDKKFIDLASLFTPEGTFTPHKVNGDAWIRMEGRENIAKIITQGVGQAVAIHHLFSYETKVLTPTTAHSVISMEDWVIHPDDEILPSNEIAFRTMHGFGHYHADFVKIDATWYISKLVQTRVKMDFTYAKEGN
jgi:hypothetical protein